MTDHDAVPTDPGRDRTGRSFFEGVYAASEDPWSFGTDPYELDRYRHIVSLLGGAVHRSAFEPGCSVGVLTALLAPHCERLLATDLSGLAAARARARCADHPHVEVVQGRFPDVLPDAPVDLVVLSEIGYYFTTPALEEALGRLVTVVEPGALVVSAHWTGVSTDHVTSGDEVHRTLTHFPSFQLLDEARREGYVSGRFRVRRAGART